MVKHDGTEQNGRGVPGAGSDNAHQHAKVTAAQHSSPGIGQDSRVCRSAKGQNADKGAVYRHPHLPRKS